MYDPAKAPVLYKPVLDSAGARVAVDPRNPSVFLPAALIGQMVPGTGDLKNGIVQAGDPGYPRALVDFQGIMAAPRLGFSWDLFGDGNTALRGGFGVNYNPRNGSGITGDLQSNPPIVYQPQVLYGTTATYRDATGHVSARPHSRDSLNRSNVPARVYNTTLGIQRRIGFGTVLDVAYVGTFGRHIGQKSQVNNLPYGTKFLAANFDPSQTSAAGPAGRFSAPIPGIRRHSLPQLRGQFQLPLAASLSAAPVRPRAPGWRCLHVVQSHGRTATAIKGTSRPSFHDGSSTTAWPTYDRTHIFAANYLWECAGRAFDNRFLTAHRGWMANLRDYALPERRASDGFRRA